MQNKSKCLGNKGEEIAAKYLEEKGYKIISRNVRLKFAEADIIAESGDYLVIIEVKTTKPYGKFGYAEELVRYKKQKKLLNIARYYLQKYPDKKIRIDVIGIDMSSGSPKINHIKNAVEEK